MPIRQTWKIKIRGVLRLLNSSLAKAARNEELEFTSSAIYSDDSDEYDSEKELEVKKVKRRGNRKGPLSIKSVSSDTNTISSKDLQECNECGKMRTINWCKNCESKEFIKNFSNWSSKNDLLDKFIRNTQYKAYNHRYYWEWIPFEKFSNLQFLSNGGQTNNVFTAIWLEGPRNQWDNENLRFVRRKWCKVILKKLAYSPNNISIDFINKIRKYYGHQKSRCSRVVQIYGLTQDPKSGRYMLVTAYHNKLDIRTLLQENSKLSWSDKLRMLQDCAEALLDIHLKGHVHKNFHPGNLLLHSKGKNIFLNISDLGLCNNSCNNNYNSDDDDDDDDDYNNDYNYNNYDEEIIGVIPYVAPEILSCWPYTQDSDIYSFSMLMFELATGKPPFYDRAHDQHLIFDICEGLRPNFDSYNIPICYKELMKQCWDTEPVNRPCANEILFIINNWNIDDFTDMKFGYEDFVLHPDAIYTSRPLGELISRELELQEQVWEETEFSVQDDEMEESSEEEEEEEDEEEDDDNDSRSDRKLNSESNSEHEDDNSEQLVESNNKTNEFQLKLELKFGESLMDTKKINENDSSNDDDEEESDDDDDDDDDDEEDDDSLTEFSSNNTNNTNNTNSPNTSGTSVCENETKHEEDTSN